MRLDLHVHTALSACAENALSPAAIVGRAAAAGLSMMAVTDHNASANLAVTIELGRRVGLTVVPGVEVATREEVHVLALFDEPAALVELQAIIDSALPGLDNQPDFFGLQLVYDLDDEIVDLDPRLRQVGIDLGLEQLTGEVRRLGGYLVPAHVQRGKNSLISQLGFIDPLADFDAVELSVRDWQRQGCRPGQRLAGFPVLMGSDAHFLEDVGRHWFELPGQARTVGEALGLLRRLCA